MAYKTIWENTQTKYNSNNANNAKQNYSGSVASYNTQPANKMRIFYNTPEPIYITCMKTGTAHNNVAI